MKKSFFYAASLFMGIALMATSCSSDDNKGNEGSVGGAESCVQQIIDGCIDIANEVGTAKIGDPVDLYSTDPIRALYSVESWYSYHSIEDYSNNILSIRNAYYGSRNGSISTKSLSTVIAANNSSLDTRVKNAIDGAYDAIYNGIPTPFRNNINSQGALDAMDACADLEEVLKDLKGYIERTPAVNSDEVLDPIVTNYVDAVVLPTYKDLKDKNTALYNSVKAFAQNPSNQGFSNACDAWLTAREPWETSEAFLFGPVDAEGLDPNMDSWPLDQDAIVNILNSGDYDDLNWSDGDSDDDIEAIQSVRGFHTLEFLLFRNGQARTLNDVANSSDNADLVYNSSNATSWGNYMVQVAYLLKQDAENLYNNWSVSYKGGTSYAEQFKAHKVK